MVFVRKRKIIKAIKIILKSILILIASCFIISIIILPLIAAYYENIIFGIIASVIMLSIFIVSLKSMPYYPHNVKKEIMFSIRKAITFITD